MRGFVLRRLAQHGETITRRYQEGASFHELAGHFGCGWSTIRRFLISQDVPLRHEPRRRKLDHSAEDVLAAFRAGTAIDEIATRFQVQPQTVRNFLLDKMPIL